MKLTNVAKVIDRETFSPLYVGTFEIRVEALQDIAFYHIDDAEVHQALGQELMLQLKDWIEKTKHLPFEL